MGVYRQPGLGSVEHGRGLRGQRMVVEDQPDHGVLQQFGSGPGKRMHQQVYAHSVADQVLAEPRVAGDQGGPPSVVDPITEGGLDRIAMIDFEGGHTHTTTLVDDAIRRELVYYDASARRIELLIGD